jgi:predicted GH43/DUF377 family glycosyl hydrolase
MKIFRSPRNPIISPADVAPSRADFEVICAFNCGVTRFKGDVLLLIRVAEIPKNNNPDKELVPIFNTELGEIEITEFDKTDSTIDYSDSRFVRTGDEQYLTSISHLRIARSRNGVDFEIDKIPAMLPANKREYFE